MPTDSLFPKIKDPFIRWRFNSTILMIGEVVEMELKTGGGASAESGQPIGSKD